MVPRNSNTTNYVCPHQQVLLLPVVLLRRERPVQRVEVRRVVHRRLQALGISLFRDGERRGRGDRRRRLDQFRSGSRRRPSRRLVPVRVVRGQRVAVVALRPPSSVATTGVWAAAAAATGR